ncbi:lamin tail domain-containing protein [Gracilibacillus suaedae]|uniref:lamin tail domain-containing protein n=1 Tax=Gracilibacillus suaedae TaxID=2820273 RepID=UPI001ABE9675|nr:lamin tail domain-containing protein [Gracilibacillus suaedae]
MRKKWTSRLSLLVIFLLIFTNVLAYGPIAYANTDEVIEQEETATEQNEETNLSEESLAGEKVEGDSSSTQEEQIHNEETETESQQDNEKEEAVNEEEASEENSQEEVTNSDEEVESTQEEATTEENSDKKLEAQSTIDYQTLPPLLLTEIMPNNDGSDNFEYFEVYNNSDQAVLLDYYTIALRYTDGSATDKNFDFPEVSIPAGETIVFWHNPEQLTVADFNAHYSTELTEDQIVSYQGTNFYNSGNRGVVIKDDNEDIVTNSYLEEDIASGKVVTYQYPTESIEMERYQTVTDPTPGTVEEEQIPEEKVIVEQLDKPVIDHTPVTEGKEGKAITITAELSSEGHKVTGTLHYLSEEGSFEQIDMTSVENNVYEATINSENVPSGELEYYITATNPQQRVRLPEVDSETFTIDVTSIDESKEDFQQYPHLLITEISPNTEGGGTDYFEYFELYNNTNQTLSFHQYAHIYYYTDSGREVQFKVPPVDIESQETLVFWYNNGNHSLEDFNNHFSTNLTSEQVIEVTDTTFPVFANGGNRALILRNASQEEVIYADYDGADNDNNGGVIQYKYPYEGTRMTKLETLAEPTPGMISDEQVPSEVVKIEEPEEDTTAPVITHESVTEAEAFSSVPIEAEVTDDLAIPDVTLFVKNGDSEYRSLSMSTDPDEPGKYKVEIPGIYVKSDLTYYIEATDGVNTKRTEEYTVSVLQDEVDTQSLPPLLVTEIVPDSTNVGTADGYEFIEIYNNTDQDIPFEHYKIQYRYGNDPASDVVWPSIPDDVVIPAGETLVFWIINGQNNDQTVADFNANYGSNLIENENIVRIESAGMANGSMRGLIVASNIGREYSTAYYNDLDTTDDTAPNKGIVYKYPSDDSNIMEKVSAATIDATPGAVEDYQVPTEPVQGEEDQTAPVVEDITSVDTINQTDDLDVTAEASDQEELKTVAIYYRTNANEDYKKALIEEGEDEGEFTYRIYAPEMIGNTEVEYYFVASDGENTTTTNPEIVTIESNLDHSPLRLNVEKSQILNGTFVLKGTSNLDQPADMNMLIDGNQVPTKYQAIEHEAYFAFEVSGIHTYFQNGVTIGDEIIHIFDDWMAQWETITVPIDPHYLEIGENTITIRAGNKATPWEGDPGENRDDYNLRNVRLVLADGTILTDPNHPDPENVLDMGDDGTNRIAEDFTFTISEDHAQSIAYEWDTTEVTDGEHTIEVTDSKETIQEQVLVDNTAPNIEATVANEETYKGTFIIDAEIDDNVAGVDSYQAKLDGEEIDLPLETSSGELTNGEHTLTITATDQVGNKATKEITFYTVEENPEAPENLSNIQDGDPTLKVLVDDPMGDKMDVGFYQGFQYKPSDTDAVVSYQGASAVEPPNTNEVDGSTLLEEEDISLVAEKDGEYLVNDATTEFPYHRFDVTLDDTVNEDDLVELEWSGNSLEGRKVTMYAWNVESSKWDIVDYQIAGEEDFILKGDVEVASYSKDHQIQVMIQDEIPANRDEYDYTFVWMSDTQYYSESYPHIFDRQTEWIKEQQEEMKIEYVFHSGDLVDEADQPNQWEYADEYMRTLDDAEIPYGVLAGNHDVLQKTEDYAEYYKYFGEDRFNDKPYYGGSYLNNRGHYDLISVDGNDYIMLYLGWGIDDEGIAWMNEVLRQHPDRTAILTFHEYLQATGTRHPLGEKLYQEVVLPNENVVAVLSGHYHEAQTLVDEIDDDGDGNPDRKVYQMLADYQAGPEGGQGYMRLLHFDTDNNQIFVNTYSPYVDDYNYYNKDEYPNKDEFTIDLDLTAKEKRVATDSFVVNVYTDHEIGKVENVASGDTAEVTWEGLTEGEQYFWYATLTDNYTGESRSPIWSFVKGEDDTSGNDKDKDKDNETDKNKPEKHPDSNTDLDSGSGLNKEDNDNNQSAKSDDVQETEDASSKQEDENSDRQSPTASNDHFNLPSTATNTFQNIALSIILLIIGTILYVRYRKQLN